MNDNEQLLMGLHKGAEMGRNTIDKLISYVEDKPFKALLERHRKEYSRIYMSADVLLKSLDGDDGDLPAMAKAMGDLMIDMTTLTDRSTLKLAELVMKGTKKGIEQFNEDMEKYSRGASTETNNLARVYGEFLEHNQQELKRYV